MIINVNRKQVNRILIIILINLILISIGDRLIGWLFHAPAIGRGIFQRRSIRLRQHVPDQDRYIRPPDKLREKGDVRSIYIFTLRL
jgi:hypothetical protein